MELSFAFFADNATVPPDGKVYVMGGGFNTIALPQLPGRASFAVVAGFRFGSGDTSAVHRVELRFVDSDGKLVLPPATLQFQSQGPPPSPGQQISLPTVTYLQPTLGEAGDYAAEYWHEGKLLTSLLLHVIEHQHPAPQGPRPN